MKYIVIGGHLFFAKLRHADVITRVTCDITSRVSLLCWNCAHSVVIFYT